MRRWLALTGILAAVIAVALLASRGVRPDRPDSGNGSRGTAGHSADADVDDPAAVDLPPATGAILGTIRRGGEPAPATIEVRRIRGPEPYREEDSWRDYDTAPLDSGEAGKPDHRGATDDAGRFVAAGVPAGTFEVLARAGDGATASTMVVRLSDGERSSADLSLPEEPAAIGGIAVFLDGTPWRGEIQLVPDAEGGWLEWDRRLGAAGRVRADERGRFAATGLVPGRYWPAFRLDRDTLIARRPVEAPGSEPVRLVVDEGFFDVAGRVVDDATGRPVAGATVLVDTGSAKVGWVIARRTTGGDGSFRVPLIRCCPVRAVAPGYGPTDADWDGEGTDVLIRLKAEARLRGTATLVPEGRPAVGFVVEIVLEEGWTGDAVARVTTDEAGRYDVAGLPEGVVAARVGQSGRTIEGAAESEFGGYHPAAVRLVAGETTVLDLRLVVAARVRGRVVDSSGNGLPGTRVVATENFVLSSEVHRAVAVTDASGEFSFEALPAGVSYTFTARPIGRCATWITTLAFAEEETRIELRVPDPRWVEVTVLDAETREPLEGAQVDDPESDVESAVTGRDGRARVGPLPPGRTTLTCAHAEYLAPSVPLVVRESDGPRVFREVNLRKGLVLAGRLTLDGSPPSHGHVTVRVPERGWADSGTDTEGRFRITGLPPGRYDLRASASRDDALGRLESRVGAGDEDLRLEMVSDEKEGDEPTLAPIVVIVRDSSGRPVEGGSVDWGEGSTRNVEKSRATLWREAPAVVCVYGARDAESRRLAPAVIGPVGPGEATLTLGPARSLSGRVVGPDGEPVRGIHVSAVPRIPPPPNRVPDWRPHAETWTDLAGRFRLDGLGDLSYRLRLEVPRRFVRPASMVVRPGGAEPVIRLGRAVEALITVLDEAGKPVANAYCSAAGEDWEVDAFTDHAGRALLTGLEADGEAELSVWPYRPDLGDHVDDAWRPGPTTVRLARCWVVRGVVRDPRGRPVPKAHLHYLPVGGDGVLTSWADDLGEFEIGDLDPGAVELWARSWHGRRASEKVTVPAGTDGIVLLLDPGADLTVVLAGWSDPGLSVAARLRDERTGEWRSDSTTDDEVLFREVDTDRTHEVLIGPTMDGRWASREGLEPGRHEISLIPGKAVRGRVLAPAGATSIVAKLVRRGLTWKLALDEALAFSWDDAPPGPCVLRATAKLGDRTLSAEVPVESGAADEIVLDLR